MFDKRSGSSSQLLLAGITLLAVGCSDQKPAASTACVAFDTQACWGPAACQGGQMCKADGSGWSTCDCGSPLLQDGSAPVDAGTAQDANSGLPLVCANDSKATSFVCDDTAIIRMGTSKYWINNDVWGRPTADTTSRQCIWASCAADSGINWGTSWDWSGGKTVKAYPSVVLGWQWGLQIKDTGLPVQLSENRTIASGWQFSVTQNDDGPFSLDVAYDLWIHTIPNPNDSGAGVNEPSDEVMIWLYTSDTRPAGTLVVPGINVAGTSWDLWEGPIQSWNVHSFTRSANTTSATLNINDFLSYLVKERGLESTKYLTSVQAGTEVLRGAGEVDTSLYYCNVQ